MMNSGIYQPPIRDFMDDLTVTTSTHIYKQDGPFQRWKIEFPWRVWVKFNPKMAMLTDLSICKFKVGNPIRCFGKWFNESLIDKDSIEYTTKMFQTWLKIVDSSELPEKHTHNAWIYQQGIPSRLMWLLYIYDMKLQLIQLNMAWSFSIIHIDGSLRQLNPIKNPQWWKSSRLRNTV